MLEAIHHHVAVAVNGFMLGCLVTALLFLVQGPEIMEQVNIMITDAVTAAEQVQLAVAMLKSGFAINM